MPYCSTCGKEAAPEDNFCPACGSNLTSEKANQYTGNSNYGISGNNIINNSDIHIGSIGNSNNQNHSSSESQACIHESMKVPLRLFKSPIKSWYVFSFGALSILGSLASLAAGIGIGGTGTILICLFGTFPLFIGLALHKYRFLRMGWFNIRAQKNGNLLLTRVSGNCPTCDGRLHLADIEKQTIVQCSRNPDHIWRFDYTIFDDQN
ncbi:zinc-ribbon domain-containing protein [Halodesulfovibrio spirochaetisodalis]|uniref:Zinc-ribbon domain-containing protein n=1 Tax=Halodesulfovibrio spirochaetisodalis TaxID=1560234 RepID=A0A1B7XML4_9BACT|nr:zinc-ribbon domain-containing protein [Halodesulfovibrio spirochaetisodalis]OBQ56753.1 hypothetical protein SP90_01315 [Halodesulfovibrio spirochaetisodalis]